MATLKGITWDHPRGYRGLEIATDAFMRLRPDITVEWDRHSLHHFEFHPVPDLAATYDLIVLDHPCIGDAVSGACLLDLSQFSEALELDNLAQDVVGRSLETYRYEGRLWALPLDAACQVAVARMDILGSIDGHVPRTLDEVRDLASKAKIAIGFKGVHALMTFYTLCANMGSPPFAEPEGGVVARDTGSRALGLMREILSWCPADILNWSSIAALDAMRDRDDLAYCPYVFGYSSYSASTVRRGRLRFVNIPGVDDDRPGGSVIGGTGLAISRACEGRDAALELGNFLMSREVQIGMALQLGQPGRRSAWLDRSVNEAFDNFYKGTLATIEQAYLRPRYPEYLKFQWEAGQLLEGFLRDGGESTLVLDKLNSSYRQSISKN